MIDFTKKSILIVAAHPDDEVLGCGGMISRFSNKSDINIIFLGEGSSCRYSDLNNKSIKAEIEERKISARKAASFLNVKNLEFHKLTCGRFDQIPIIEINKIIESSIVKYKPDILFTHDSKDINNDHRIVFRSSLMSTRPNSIASVKTVLTYEVPSSSECSFDQNGGFNPNYFLEISEVDLTKKSDALLQYTSEVKPYPFPRSRDGLKVYASFRGMQASVNYAEAFHLVRSINYVS